MNSNTDYIGINIDGLYKEDIKKDKNNYILLRFATPLIYFKINTKLFKDGIIKCFYKSALIATKKITKETVFELANITDILIPLSFHYITKITYLTEDSLISQIDDIDYIPITSDTSILKNYFSLNWLQKKIEEQ